MQVLFIIWYNGLQSTMRRKYTGLTSSEWFYRLMPVGQGKFMGGRAEPTNRRSGC